ncbi:hypothetical protein I302_106437 [Kwoniella bestiolae CBS 10118]|uniref:Xylanolytic transcriptional activator regulatory domain-containing protein n=1 Tax=Kwoniella bestiolae CBS 10118 TaxID=1296100 RepID=A0AAJ8MA28_9TREE
MPCQYPVRKRRGTGSDAVAKAMQARIVSPSPSMAARHLPAGSQTASHLPPIDQINRSGILANALDAEQSQLFTSGHETGGTSSSIGSSSLQNTSQRQFSVSQHLDPGHFDSWEGQDLGSGSAWTDTGFNSTSLSAAISSVSASIINAEDPVSLHFLSLIEAGNLFLSFITHMNAMIAIFDPKVHTFQKIREYPLLFTAVLAVSSKFFNRNLAAALSSHARMLLHRAIFAGEYTTQMVKALIILVFWKHPTDRTAWVDIGIAMRLSYQLGLHTSPIRGEMDVDEGLDRKRTWFCGYSLRSYSDMFDLPTTIKIEEHGNLDQWIQHLNSQSCPADWHLACSMEIAQPHHTWMKYKRERDTIPLDWRRSILADLRSQYDRHTQRWFASDLRLSEIEYHFLLWYDKRMMVSIRFELLECADPQNQPLLLQELIADTRAFVDQTSIVAGNGSMLYLQDTTAVHLSTLGIVIYKVFWRLQSVQRKEVVDMIQRIHRCVKPFSNQDDSSPFAYIARFFNRLVRKLSSESRAPSRAVSPALIAPTGDDLLTEEHLDQTAEMLNLGMEYFIDQDGPDLQQGDTHSEEAYW